jgi:hypothetical protein
MWMLAPHPTICGFALFVVLSPLRRERGSKKGVAKINSPNRIGAAGRAAVGWGIASVAPRPVF